MKTTRKAQREAGKPGKLASVGESLIPILGRNQVSYVFSPKWTLLGLSYTPNDFISQNSEGYCSSVVPLSVFCFSISSIYAVHAHTPLMSALIHCEDIRVGAMPIIYFWYFVLPALCLVWCSPHSRIIRQIISMVFSINIVPKPSLL